MGFLETIIKTAVEAAPDHPGSQIQLLYIVLNMVIPILLGIALVWITRFIDKGLTRLLGEKH